MQQRDRLEGVALASLVALAGIVALPIVFATGAWDAEGGATALRLLDGPPVALLAMVLGAVLARRAGPRLASRDRAGAVRAGIGRGLWVAMLGVVLGTVGALLVGVSSYATLLGVWLPIGDVTVWAPPLDRSGDLLVPLGIALVLAAPLLLLPGWAMGLAAALLVAGMRPLTELALTLVQTGGPLQHLAGGGALTHAVVGPLLLGPHPALWLLAPVLLGALVARSVAAVGGRRSRLALAIAAAVGLALVGASLALAPALRDAGSFLDAIALPFASFAPQSPLDALLALGLALAVLGAAALVADVLPHRVRAVLAPAFAAGAAPLTLLVSHLVLSALLTALAPTVPVLGVGWGSGAVQAAAMLAVGAFAAATGRQGPVDAFVERRSELLGGLARGAAPLDVVMPDDTSLEYSRTYPATVEQVWRAITEPAHVMRWLPDPTMPLRSCAMDVRPGGRYRYEYGGLLSRGSVSGHYPHVQPPSMLVTQVQPPGGDRPPYASVDRLEARGDRTLHHVRDVFASRVERDAALQRLPYMAACLERLERHLEQGVDSRAA